MSDTRTWKKAIPKISPREILIGLQAGIFHALRRTGDSLAKFGIEKDDMMIFAKAEYDHEYDESQIEHWANSKDEVWVGFACDNFGDIYIYHAKNEPVAI
jgi:hypothetical protein